MCSQPPCHRSVVPGCAGLAGCAVAHPDFGRSANPISARGTDYARLITTGTPGFSDLPTALHGRNHGLRTPREDIAFTARPKIHSHSQIFRYGGSIFCLPHRPNFSDIFDLCLHWMSVVRVRNHMRCGNSYQYQYHNHIKIKVSEPLCPS